MKKLISIVLTLSLVLSLSATAFATTVTITGDGASYKGYKILNLTTSLKTGTHHDANCTGEPHSEDCYNFAYTVNGKYREILQAEVFGNAGPGFWDADNLPDAAADVTDDKIMDYLESLESDNGEVFGSARTVADRIYRAIIAAGKTHDVDNVVSGDNTIGNGYWIFADVTDNSGDTDVANSLVILDTKGDTAVTLNPKTAIPQLEKKVKDIEDSEDDLITDNPWQDSADFDIGDSDIPFKLTGTLPSNAKVYQTYKLVFHD